VHLIGAFFGYRGSFDLPRVIEAAFPATAGALPFHAAAVGELPFHAAAVGELPFLREMIAIFAVGTVIVYLCRRLRLVPIVGYLLTGVLIGPFALGLVRDLDLIASTAEVGVILLLFSIGVEFRLEKLSRIRHYIVLGGGLQVVGTVGLVALLLAALGIEWHLGVYTGYLVALSSTALVLKLLSDRARIDTPTGQISLGILIFQDLSVVVMVLTIPILGSGDGSLGAVVLALLEGLVIIAIVLEAARRIVPPVLDRVAHLGSPELFLLVVVVICFGIAWLATLAGISLALGAFLAGLVVSRSRFREHAVGEILPLRTLFSAVFFVSVGMLLDVRVAVAEPLLLLGAVFGVFFVKSVLTGFSVRSLRYPSWMAAVVGLGLAQIGEFSLVLHNTGRVFGLSPAGLGQAGEQVFLAVVVLLMIATPFLTQLEPLARRILRSRTPLPLPEAATEPRPGALVRPRDHVIICGYGLTGRYLERVCRTFEVPYRIVDLNPVTAVEAEARGVPFLYGDLGQPEVQERAGIHEAKLLVVAINDADASVRIVQQAKLASPSLPILARARYLFEADSLEDAGADVVVAEEVESALVIVQRVARQCGIPEEEASLQAERLRTLGSDMVD
jgi:CPA2 family monovalent cation:H+ antiporter-2